MESDRQTDQGMVVLPSPSPVAAVTMAPEGIFLQPQPPMPFPAIGINPHTPAAGESCPQHQPRPGHTDGGAAHMPPHRVSGRIRQVPGCPRPGNPGECLQRTLGTQNSSPHWCQWPRDAGPRELRRHRSVAGPASQQVQQVPGLVLMVTGSGPSSCLRQLGGGVR